MLLVLLVEPHYEPRTARYMSPLKTNEEGFEETQNHEVNDLRWKYASESAGDFKLTLRSSTTRTIPSSEEITAPLPLTGNEHTDIDSETTGLYRGIPSSVMRNRPGPTYLSLCVG